MAEPLYRQLDRDQLRRWFVEEHLSPLAIAQRAGVSRHIVEYALYRYGIRHDAGHRARVAIDEEWLRARRVDEGLTVRKIATLAGASEWVIRARLMELNLGPAAAEVAAPVDPGHCCPQCAGWDRCLDDVDAPCVWAEAGYVRT
jgi:AraC-like DNA-binding protein